MRMLVSKNKNATQIITTRDRRKKIDPKDTEQMIDFDQNAITNTTKRQKPASTFHFNFDTYAK